MRAGVEAGVEAGVGSPLTGRVEKISRGPFLGAFLAAPFHGPCVVPQKRPAMDIDRKIRQLAFRICADEGTPVSNREVWERAKFDALAAEPKFSEGEWDREFNSPNLPHKS